MPSRIPDTSVFYWIHVAGLLIGLVLAVVLFRRLWRAGGGAPSQEREGGGETPDVPVRHPLADVLPGVALFVGVFVAYALVQFPLRAAGGETTIDPIALALSLIWVAHDLYRGAIHPWLSHTRPPATVRHIAPSAASPMLLFGFLAGSHLGGMSYPDDWLTDPRFIAGALLMVLGIVASQWVDVQRARRRRAADAQAGRRPSRELSSPDFLGEECFWLGWALASWSLAGLVRAIYQTALFVPLARARHRRIRSLNGSAELFRQPVQRTGTKTRTKGPGSGKE